MATFLSLVRACSSLIVQSGRNTLQSSVAIQCEVVSTVDPTMIQQRFGSTLKTKKTITKRFEVRANGKVAFHPSQRPGRLKFVAVPVAFAKNLPGQGVDPHPDLSNNKKP